MLFIISCVPLVVLIFHLFFSVFNMWIYGILEEYFLISLEKGTHTICLLLILETSCIKSRV